MAVVAGALVAARTYLDLERQTHSGEVLTATLDRLYQDHQLSMALMTITRKDSRRSGTAFVALQSPNAMVSAHFTSRFLLVSRRALSRIPPASSPPILPNASPALA